MTLHCACDVYTKSMLNWTFVVSFLNPFKIYFIHMNIFCCGRPSSNFWFFFRSLNIRCYCYFQTILKNECRSLYIYKLVKCGIKKKTKKWTCGYCCARFDHKSSRVFKVDLSAGCRFFVSTHFFPLHYSHSYDDQHSYSILFFSTLSRIHKHWSKFWHNTQQWLYDICCECLYTYVCVNCVFIEGSREKNRTHNSRINKMKPKVIIKKKYNSRIRMTISFLYTDSSFFFRQCYFITNSISVLLWSLSMARASQNGDGVN